MAARKLSGGRPTVWTVTDLQASAPAWASAPPAAAVRYGAPQQDGAAPSGLALTQIEFAVVDVETTGWSPAEARITEIGAVRLRAGRVTGEFSTLVDPGMPVPADIEALTGISSQMVSTAPRAADALPALLGFAHGCVLAAHNARRRARGEAEVSVADLEMRVMEDLHEQRRRHEEYLVDRDLDELLETTNARRRARGLPERTRAQVREEFGPGPSPES